MENRICLSFDDVEILAGIYVNRISGGNYEITDLCSIEEETSSRFRNDPSQVSDVEFAIFVATRKRYFVHNLRKAGKSRRRYAEGKKRLRNIPDDFENEIKNVSLVGGIVLPRQLKLQIRLRALHTSVDARVLLHALRVDYTDIRNYNIPSCLST